MDGGLRKIPWARVWVAAAAVTGIAVLIVVLLVTDRVPASEPPPPQAPAPAPSMSPGVLSSERLRIPAFGLSYEAGARRDHHRACDGPGQREPAGVSASWATRPPMPWRRWPPAPAPPAGPGIPGRVRPDAVSDGATTQRESVPRGIRRGAAASHNGQGPGIPEAVPTVTQRHTHRRTPP